MKSDPNKPKPWLPRVQLWHLFALVTFTAVLVWLAPQLGLQLDHQPGKGSRAAIVWNGDLFEVWNTWPPPPTVSWEVVAIPGPDGPVRTTLPKGANLPSGARITESHKFRFDGPDGTTTLELPVVTWPSNEP